MVHVHGFMMTDISEPCVFICVSAVYPHVCVLRCSDTVRPLSTFRLCGLFSVHKQH